MTRDRYCAICGYEPPSPPWGAEGRLPSFDICPCCGVTWGYEDSGVSSIERYRARWLAAGAAWYSTREPADGLATRERLARIGVDPPD